MLGGGGPRVGLSRMKKPTVGAAAGGVSCEWGWCACWEGRGRLGNVWLQPGPSKAGGDRGRALEVGRGQSWRTGVPNLEAGEFHL